MPVVLYRFTTFERVEEVPLVVVKSDGSTQPFDRDKIVFGVRAASKGRTVTEEQIQQLAPRSRTSCGSPVATSRRAGSASAVLDRLRLLDEVAYLRFASVYKNFDAASDFQSELELLSKLGSDLNHAG